MKSNTTLKWIEAAKILASDPLKSLECPECQIGTLLVKDERGIADPSVVERKLICSSCGKYNYLRMVRPL